VNNPSPITPSFSEALEFLLGIHTSREASGEIAVRAFPDDLSPDQRRRYERAWKALAEGRANAGSPPAGT